MKVFDVLIFSILLYFVFSGLITQVKVDDLTCDISCEISFKDYITSNQTYILPKKQYNPFIYPFSDNPGLATYIKEGENKGSIYFIKKETSIHSEMNFIKGTLLQQTAKEYHYHKHQSNLRSNDYYSYVRGNIFLFTFLGPCEDCLTTYKNLANSFKNVMFHVFFVQAYYDSNLKLELSKTFSDLRNQYKKCSSSFLEMIQNIKGYNRKSFINYNNKLEEYIKDWTPFYIFNSFNNCIFSLYKSANLASNLKFERLNMDPSILNFYESLSHM